MAPADHSAGPAPDTGTTAAVPPPIPSTSLRRTTATRRKSAASVNSMYSTASLDKPANEWGIDPGLSFVAEEPASYIPDLDAPAGAGRRESSYATAAEIPSSASPDSVDAWSRTGSALTTTSRNPLTAMPVHRGANITTSPTEYSNGTESTGIETSVTGVGSVRASPKPPSQGSVVTPPVVSFTPTAVPTPYSSSSVPATSTPSDGSDAPSVLRPILANTFTASPPGMSSVSGGKPSTSSRPKPQLRLSTMELPPPKKEDKPPLSPGMKHWQQVRQHVMTTAPSPLEEKPDPKHKAPGVLSRTAGRLGFRSVVENVLGYDRRRGSTYGAFPIAGMTDEEREEASRQRRRFARDVKVCLDACAAEESMRRLRRLAAVGGQVQQRAPMASNSSSKPKSAHQSAHGYLPRTMTAMSANSFAQLPPGAGVGNANELSAFGPLLIELHKFVHDARAKRVWSRTCPHHSAILAELGTTFLPDSASTDGERAQALEVFRTIIRYWSTDSEEDELDRWLWLCRAMLIDDRALRDRGLALLSQLLRGSEDLPECLVRPASALDFESVAIALLMLLHAIESAPYASEQQRAAVLDLLADLGAGKIIRVDPDSLLDLLQDLDIDSAGRIEPELLWFAAAKTIAADEHVGRWMLDCNAEILRRFAPPPVLPGMSRAARRLRLISSNKLLASLSTLVRTTDDEDVLTAVARMGSDVYCEAVELPDHDSIVAGYATLLLALNSSTAANIGADVTPGDRLRDLLAEHKGIVTTIAKLFVTTWPAVKAMAAIRRFLQSDLAPLGRACVPLVLEQLSTLPPDLETSGFLSWLSMAQPQLLYKPLFACAAATQAESLEKPLRIVQALAEHMGTEAFWTRADPQMAAIVLAGDVSPKQSKGKGKEGSTGAANVKLGRYAILIELTLALRTVGKPTSQLAKFALALETQLGAMLEVEEKAGDPLPPVYRSLVAQMINALRVSSNLIKRTAATRLIVQWYTSTSWRDNNSSIEVAKVDSLTKLYKARGEHAKHNACLQVPISETLPTLLVVIQASLGSDDWGTLLPIVWERYGQMGQPLDQLTFLMMKCAEAARGGLRNLVHTELFNAGPSVRASALLKLAVLYGNRFQVFTQETVTDRRGLNFRFPQRSLEFVMADMGSQTWVTPRDAQDAALKKYGRSLPLELRQRLMELGWTEDEEMTASDIERMPVTAVPPTGKGSPPLEVSRSVAAAATPAIARKGSNSSMRSTNTKIHRAVVPPDLVTVTIDQARLLAVSDDIVVEILSKELVRMFQREDPSIFMRPVSEALPYDIGGALSRLNGVIAQPTPGFAYTAVNVLVGYLKTAVRNDSAFPHWAAILGTVTRLIPFVCEMSLRDVRKTKAEHVLLPASIYETEGGFKLHRPWQEDVLLDVQTAQLVLLSNILRVNPRDVYIVKKMLFNLQVQESMRYLPFARAWIELIVVLFSAVNSNYNDRAELRHFLYNINTVLGLHGVDDLVVASHAMRALSLCATRFRRVFASIGFVEVMQPVYTVYVRGHEGIKDAVECAVRSFYRIHQDVFVYQLCLALAENTFNSQAAYNLLACLSLGDVPDAGVPSGIRGLNDKAEIEAVVQMMSGGAEVSLSELTTRADIRQQKRAASLSLEPVVFPTDNIIRLLVTVIAVNAASKRGIKLMRLFGALAPHLHSAGDERSRALLAEALDVIGRFIQRMRASDDTALQRLLPGDVASVTDWPTARHAYVHLIDDYTRAGGAISVNATRRLLDIVSQVLQDDGGQSGPIVANILGALARAHLTAAQSPFLGELVSVYRLRLPSVDFSGVLEAISALIRQHAFVLPSFQSRMVVKDYLGPALRMLALASDESMAFVPPMRKATVELLSLAVFLRGVDALDQLERVPTSAGLLAGVVLPLTLQLERPHDVDRDDIWAGLWVRILRLSLRSPRGPATSQAAQAALALQITKVIAVRVPDAISAERGLWTYLANYIKEAVQDGNGRFYTHDGATPRIIDWMMWSLFELLSLYRMPVALALRLRIQQALAAVAQDREHISRPSTAGSGSSSGPGPSPMRSLSGLVRRPSARIPSGSSSLSPLTPRIASLSPPPSHGPLTPVPEATSSPSLGPTSSPNLGPTLSPSLSSSSTLLPQQHATLPSPSPHSPTSPHSPHLPTTPNISISLSPSKPTGHGRTLSAASTSSALSWVGSSTHRGEASTATAASRRSHIRPSFTALSARRASRPTFDAFTPQPDESRRHTVRPAIAHLIGPAMAAVGGGGVASRSRGDPLAEALASAVRSDVLAESARRGLMVTLVVYGYEVDEDVEVHAWSAPDALHAITEQTRALVEDELADVFTAGTRTAEATKRLSRADLSDREDADGAIGKKSRPTSKHSEYSNPWEDEGEHLPSLSYTLNHGFEEGYSLSTDTSGVFSPAPAAAHHSRENSAVSRDIPVVAISHA